MPIAILYSEELREYDFGPGHSFRGDRYEVFPRFLREKLSDESYRILGATPATNEDLLKVCKKDYIEFTQAYFRAANSGVYYNGNFHHFHSGDNRPIGTPGKLEEAARFIVGQAKLAADLIQQGQFKKVVSIGGGMHHAKESYGEGFCIYNDVAYAARYLLDTYRLEKILILDTDAHAGNGTCEYFYSDPRVLFIDLHQDPMTLYPGTGFIDEIGMDSGKGFTINVPVPVYAGYDSYRFVFDELIHPIAEEFKPQIIIRNGGSDPHFADGLTQLGLPLKGFRMIGEQIREISGICDGKVVDLIASGYNERVLPYAWLALIAGLADIKIPTEELESIPSRFETDQSLGATKEVLGQIKRNLSDYWACLSRS
jgi:acetoin utilization protein AcuC